MSSILWNCASIMVPAFWIWVGNFRRYGRQLREYVVKNKEMCHCHGVCFLAVDVKKLGGTGDN